MSDDVIGIVVVSEPLLIKMTIDHGMRHHWLEKVMRPHDEQSCSTRGTADMELHVRLAICSA